LIRSVIQRSPEVRFAPVLLISLLLLAGCGSGYSDKIEALKADVARLEQGGGEFCASWELASAEAFLEFAQIEIKNKNLTDADAHLESAQRYAHRGLEKLEHCRTDLDRDGIPDLDDRAPYQAEDVDGFQDTDGRPDPDNDGDGFLDKADADPNLAEDFDGFEDDDGKPDLDNDGDGVPDIRDLAPNEPEDLDGFQDADGKPDPDNDQDGFADGEDVCPNFPETFNDFKDQDGCPDVTPLVRKVIGCPPVKFYQGSARLTHASIPILARFVQRLVQSPDLRVRIEGHTDSVGDEQNNLDLSIKRARTVRNKLIQMGADPSRLEAVGYGESQPIADNNTPDGRARNRRIDFVIIQDESETPDDDESEQGP